ncbi:hypothetical protein L2E82_36391 [Cichorium intybus]|uniref:Uncharacterized protein n=1 Tax=Cichorium intybus TaxID=13427 RepID=A0ACB9BRJ7_CICIN|nr:hypothetical protein L2E82_36391 [Cichorium intybus]
MGRARVAAEELGEDGIWTTVRRRRRPEEWKSTRCLQENLDDLKKIATTFFDVVLKSDGLSPYNSSNEGIAVKIPDSLVIDQCQWLNCCLIGELKDLDLLSKCFAIFHSTGIGDCSVKYLGGLNVLLRFENHRVASAFLVDHKESWSYWFAWLNKWDSSYYGIWSPPFLTSDEEEDDDRDNSDDDIGVPDSFDYQSDDDGSFIDDTADRNRGNQCITPLHDKSKRYNGEKLVDKTGDSPRDSFSPILEEENDYGENCITLNRKEQTNIENYDTHMSPINSPVQEENVCGPHNLPDLNNPISDSNASKAHQEISRSRFHKKRMSIKFKDIIRASGQFKKNPVYVRQTSGTSMNSARDDLSTSRSSVEIRKTLQIGEAIGYQLAGGAEQDVQNIIQGEGAKRVSNELPLN